jgi:hypothetical protein
MNVTEVPMEKLCNWYRFLFFFQIGCSGMVLRTGCSVWNLQVSAVIYFTVVLDIVCFWGMFNIQDFILELALPLSWGPVGSVQDWLISFDPYRSPYYQKQESINRFCDLEIKLQVPASLLTNKKCLWYLDGSHSRSEHGKRAYTASRTSVGSVYGSLE